MRTTVVVVAHRAHEWLGRSLESVLGKADEVVLVDNGSIDAEVSEVGLRMGVKLLRVRKNLGFAGGANAGLREASGDVVGLLNDDAFAEPGWLDIGADVLADASVAAVAPKIVLLPRYAVLRFDDEPYFVSGDPRPLGRCIRSLTIEGKETLPTLFGPGIYRLESGIQGTDFVEWRWTSGRSPILVPVPDGADPLTLQVDGAPAPVVGVFNMVNSAGSYLSAEGHGGDYGFMALDDGRFDEPGDCFAASGAAMVMRRETLLCLGLFAPQYFAYYEDLDWCWRAHLAGLRVRYDPRALVRHVGGVTSGGPDTPGVRFIAKRNRILTLARNAPFEVFRRQFRRTWSENGFALRRSFCAHVPHALAQRRLLARGWRRSPSEVWEEWAGVGETWSEPSLEISP